MADRSSSQANSSLARATIFSGSSGALAGAPSPRAEQAGHRSLRGAQISPIYKIYSPKLLWHFGAMREPTSEVFDHIDRAVASFLKAADIPGAAFAIVTADGYSASGAHGVRDILSKAPMRTRTLFPIASTTKPMTATLLGMLRDEGLVGWDVPVIEYLPDFQFMDSRVTQLVTLRDLMCMRTGLGRHDWMWIDHITDRADLVARFRYLDFSAAFRAGFEYNNLTSLLAGHVAEVVAAQPWEKLLRERLLKPLGMDRCEIGRPVSADLAIGYHHARDRTQVPIPIYAAEVIGPSGGSVYADVEDMGRWIAFNLAGGRVGGHALVRSDTLAELMAPITPIPPGPLTGDNPMRALGWTVDSYAGERRVSHSGLLHDVNSDVSLFPDLGLGLVCFLNFFGPALAKCLNQYIFELLMGRVPPDALSRRLADYEQAIAQQRAALDSAKSDREAKTSRPLADYTGCFRHPAYGDFEIALEDGALQLRRGNLTLCLDHWSGDAFVAANCDALFEIDASNPFDAANLIRFEEDTMAGISILSLKLEPATERIRFERSENANGPLAPSAHVS